MNKLTVDVIELWKCKKSIKVEEKTLYKEKVKNILVKEGDVVEFRYHYSIHFRTKDNIYCVSDEKTFYENFEPYGKIYDSVKWANNCQLKDILEHELFDKWKFIKNYDKYKDYAVSLTSEGDKQ